MSLGAWWHRRMIAFDLETTDKDPFEARIVQAAMPSVGGGMATDPWSLLIDPGVEIPQEATDVHGITTEQARADGVLAAEGIARILERLDSTPPDSPLIVFNTPYDLTVMACEVARYGLGEIPFRYVVDPLVVDRHLERYRRGKRRLADACRSYNVSMDGAAHDASNDAIAGARLAYLICSRGDVVRRPRNRDERAEYGQLSREWHRIKSDLPSLHAMQAQWALAQQAQLEAYFHEGNPAKGVPPQPDRVVARGWPVLPVPVAA